MGHCQLWVSTLTCPHGSVVHDYIEKLFLCIPPQHDTMGFTSIRKASWVISNASILEWWKHEKSVVTTCRVTKPVCLTAKTVGCFFSRHAAKRPICQKHIHAQTGNKESSIGWHPVAGNPAHKNSCEFSFSVQLHCAITKCITINSSGWKSGALRSVHLYCTQNIAVWNNTAFSAFKYFHWNESS